SIFFFGGGQDHAGLIVEVVEQLKAAGTRHLHIQEQQGDRLFVKEVYRIRNIFKSCFYGHHPALFTATRQVFRCHGKILDNSCFYLHPTNELSRFASSLIILRPSSITSSNCRYAVLIWAGSIPAM